MLRACLTRVETSFPDCKDDGTSVMLNVPAAGDRRLTFSGLPSGTYALTVLHDENANNRLDKSLGIPREGIGFSNNPRLRFGPPRFSQSRFHIGAAAATQHVKMRYFI